MSKETPTSTPRPLGCEEWIAMLTDAVDGVLPAGDAVAFQAHSENCAACAQLLEEARRGAEWLQFLATEPEVPAGLAERIVLRTAGPEAVSSVGGGFPALAAAGPGLPQAQPWYGASLSILYRHPAESRLLMTVAMAFFSIAFTLNLAGVRIKEFHLRDLKPTVLATNVTRGYYSASAQVMRYYENLRFVYELESRVNELRRSAGSAPTEERKPATGSSEKPAETKTARPGGSGAAQQSRPQATPATKPVPASGSHSADCCTEEGNEPTPAIPASLHRHRNSHVNPRSHLLVPCDRAQGHAPDTRTRDQAERSLA